MAHEVDFGAEAAFRSKAQWLADLDDGAGWSAQDYFEALSSGTPEIAVLVSEANDENVGFYVLELYGGQAHLMNIVVKPSERGRGWGNFMMDDIIDRCKEVNCTTLSLRVRPDNEPAKALYERYGFNTMGIQLGYYKDGSNAIMMVKWLNS